VTHVLIAETESLAISHPAGALSPTNHRLTGQRQAGMMGVSPLVVVKLQVEPVVARVHLGRGD